MDEPRYIASSEFVFRKIGDSSVLVPVGDAGSLSNSVISLNDSYSFILEQFKAPCTVSEVIERARSEFEDPEGVMEKHIRGATEELVRHSIIKNAD